MKAVFGLHVADIFVLALYLFGMAAIGFWSARKIKHSQDFFMPRRFGKVMMVMFGFGWMFGNIIKRLCTIPWCLTGLAAIVYFGSRGVEVEPDKVFGAVAGDFLPNIMPGILGIFLAALLASVMSSCDVFMISSAALFTENIYRPLSPDRPQSHYITVGRIASVAVVSEKRNIFPNTNLEFMIPSRTSVVGFMVGWAFVAVIVAAVYLIASA